MDFFGQMSSHFGGADEAMKEIKSSKGLRPVAQQKYLQPIERPKPISSLSSKPTV